MQSEVEKLVLVLTLLILQLRDLNIHACPNWDSSLRKGILKKQERNLMASYKMNANITFTSDENELAPKDLFEKKRKKYLKEKE